MNRKKLTLFYERADILFLHLNNIPAFHRVLPSKVFEYASFNKPIIAGVEGYSAVFLKNHVPQSLIFCPGDEEQCVRLIKKADQANIDKVKIDTFISKFNRHKIMKKMASHIYNLV